jgi:tRNA(fMet)-specific endonuclease VapC
MLRYLIDTNVASEPARPEPSERVLQRVRTHAGEIALPSIAWHELVYGVRRLDEGEKKRYLSEYLTEVVRPSMPVLPYDFPAAQWHAEERVALERQGQPRPFADGQIAAIAATRDLILVTRNTSDFNPFHGLHVENWFES